MCWFLVLGFRDCGTNRIIQVDTLDAICIVLSMNDSVAFNLHCRQARDDKVIPRLMGRLCTFTIHGSSPVDLQMVVGWGALDGGEGDRLQCSGAHANDVAV